MRDISHENNDLKFTDDVQRFRNGIVDKKILVREIIFEYNIKTQKLQTKAEGPTHLGLTSAFLNRTSQQFDKIHKEVLNPLIKKVRANFSLKVIVDATGEFSFDNINIVLKFDCREKGTIHEVFYNPFKTLIPFTEYIDYIALRGTNYNLAVIEAEMNLNVLDLEDVIQMPIQGPKAKSQWYAFAVEAVAEAKKEYKLDVVIPVSEGEVTWEIPHTRKLHIMDYVGKRKVQ